MTLLENERRNRVKQCYILKAECRNGLYYFTTEYRNPRTLIKSEDGKEQILINGFLGSFNSYDEIIQEIYEKNMDYIIIEIRSDNFNLLFDLKDKLAEDSNTIICYLYEDIERNIKISEFVYVFENMDSFKKEIFHLQDIPENPKLLKKIELLYEKGTSERSDLVNQIMTNGMNLMFSGKYPNDFIISKAHHVLVEDSEILKEINIQNYMDINSAVFVIDESENNEKLLKVTKKYFVHTHKIKDEKVIFDLNNEEIPLEILDYSSFAGLKSTGNNEERRVEIAGESDFKAFISDVENFQSNGVIANPFFIMRNECRWSNRCTLTYNKRFKVGFNLMINPCFDSPEVLCSIKETEYNKSVMRRKKIDTVIIERNCRSCSAIKYCTKCSFLPKFISEDNYCSFIRKYPVLSEYFNCKNILMLLLQYTDILKNASPENIIFYNSRRTLVLPEKYIRNVKDESNEYLLFYNDEYFCFNPLKKKILKMKKGFVLMLECLKQGYSVEEIKEIFDDVYRNSTNIEEIKNHVEILKKMI